MRIDLTAEQTTKWSTADWRQGFLAALQSTVPDTVNRLSVFGSTGALLASYTRKWTAD